MSLFFFSFGKEPALQSFVARVEIDGKNNSIIEFQASFFSFLLFTLAS